MPMAAYTQNSGGLSSLLLDSSSSRIGHQRGGQVENRGDAKNTIEADRCVGASHLSRNLAPTGRLGYLNPEKGMILDSQTHYTGDEIYIDEPTANMDGTLDVTIHHANDIQNICIYGNQDVYAKFSLTHSQDAAFSTQPVKAGGKNPVFNQKLQIPVSKRDAVLKCEIWMMSCARSYLEDQLLGFVLVPLSNLAGKGKVTQDYLLTSTELFHTPAGTVCLSLFFTYGRGHQPEDVHSKMYADGSHPVSSPPRSPEVMLFGDDNHVFDPTDYHKIVFPDLQAVSENQDMLSIYLKMASSDLRLDSGTNDEIYTGKDLGDYDGGMDSGHQGLSSASFLQLGSSHVAEVDCEMTLNTVEEKHTEATQHSRDCHVFNVSSPSHATLSMEVPSSSTSVTSVPSLTEDQTEGVRQEHSGTTSNMSMTATPLPSSGNISSPTDCLSTSSSTMNDNNDMEKGTAIGNDDKGTPFLTPLVSITLEPAEPVVQQQIVDMYMKSMQQFTESLAKMKLPMDIDSHSLEPMNTKVDKGAQVEKKQGHRVFYGSRAFF